MNKQRKKELLAFITSSVMLLSNTGCKVVVNGKTYTDSNDSVTTPYKISEEDRHDLKPYETYLKDLEININNCEIVNEDDSTIYIQERVYEKYEVKKDTELSEFLELKGMNEKDFYQINEDNKNYLKTDKENNKTIKKGQTINIYTYKFHEISKLQNEKGEWIYYHVQKNDNLTKIAKKYNTSVNELCEINNIKNKDYITTDQTLKVPHPEKNKVKVKSAKK